MSASQARFMLSVLHPSCEVSKKCVSENPQKVSRVSSQSGTYTFSSKKNAGKKSLSNSACDFVRILNLCDFFKGSPVAPLELGVTDFSSPFFASATNHQLDL